ncbi:hypothetical protein OKW33_005759 [Paraburkholderia atlantica]|uniref:Uncharacterized protein n=2 Tax=Paraburkholderia TaxID=1822464 RepID=A0A7W8LHJ6_9BURK|nr:hypothetical protein [Paraburkholderia youngii]MBB5421512.1 hypothetical protein [Paraburkholderia atlantica]MBB5429433.1 hypothetical protein [Paraburkholderia atlantica]
MTPAHRTTIRKMKDLLRLKMDLQSVPAVGEGQMRCQSNSGIYGLPEFCYLCS